MKKDEKSLKESIDTLLDENERLRKKIEILEAEKEPEITNYSFEEDNILSKLLKEGIAEGYRSYLEHLNKQTKADNDNLDWRYKPSRTIDKIEIGDWPPGPQIGDPGWTPNDYPYYPYYPYGPYWSIYPPYWVMPPRNYIVTTTNTGDPVKQYNYTTSEDGEK